MNRQTAEHGGIVAARQAEGAARVAGLRHPLEEQPRRRKVSLREKGFATLQVSPQFAQRTYSTYGVRDTTLGSCPQCWQPWITARRIRFSAMRVGFAIDTGEHVIGSVRFGYARKDRLSPGRLRGSAARQRRHGRGVAPGRGPSSAKVSLKLLQRT